MNEFEFLSRMFLRLKEAREIEHIKKKEAGTARLGDDNWSIAIECTIKDYLELRHSIRPTEKGAQQ